MQWAVSFTDLSRVDAKRCGLMWSILCHRRLVLCLPLSMISIDSKSSAPHARYGRLALCCFVGARSSIVLSPLPRIETFCGTVAGRRHRQIQSTCIVVLLLPSGRRGTFRCVFLPVLASHDHLPLRSLVHHSDHCGTLVCFCIMVAGELILM